MPDENTTTETPKEVKPKAPKIEQNGVTRPKDGTSTGNVWAICDKLSAETNAPADRGAVIEAAKTQGINEATAATQHGRWRKFYGLKGRTPKPTTATTEAAPTTEPATTSEQVPTSEPTTEGADVTVE